MPGPRQAMRGALTFMVCVADLAAHHVPLTEDTRCRTEGRGHVRAMGPSQSPDISTAASARGPAHLSRPGGLLGLWGDYKLPALAQTMQHCGPGAPGEGPQGPTRQSTWGDRTPSWEPDSCL